jgi:hypothetical protein
MVINVERISHPYTEMVTYHKDLKRKEKGSAFFSLYFIHCEQLGLLDPTE